MVKAIWLWFSIIASLCLCDAYKILVIFPIPGRSHAILADGIARHLIKAGHEVSLVTPFMDKKFSPTLRLIDVSSIVKFMPDCTAGHDATLTRRMARPQFTTLDKCGLADFIYLRHLFETISEASSIKSHIYKKIDYNDPATLLLMTHMISVKTIEHENVQKLLKDQKEHFDVVIYEWMFSELLSGVSAVYNVPNIMVSSVEPHWVILSLIDEALSPAYNGDCLSAYVPPFTFKERLEELWNQIKNLFYRNYVINDMEKQEYNRLIAPIILERGRQPPSYDELKYNASLVLGNSHVSTGQPTRLPQNYKPIGGYHIEDVVKPLPEDLKTIMDSSENGVIYFSMGSNLKSKDIPDEFKQNILKLFGELNQTVLWKFEEDFAGLPNNVHILHWAPQQSILAHPKCVLFITHGGLLSTTETIHFGVPIIGIPVYGDQFINIERAKRKGFAKRVDLSPMIASDLKVAIEEILSDPRYAEKAKELSLIYHDRVASPGAELVHWVEHVVRTRGAPHLRSPALLVPWYQKVYLDFAAVVITALTISKIALKCLFSVTFSNKVAKTKKTI